ncbi:peptidase U32 family protein [Aquibacillus kalidii]|uniref:peptidase U32 family protein n=1 Tax=Aquibacillus kalidii TaxID=2762597 RepID=UPI0016446EF8|nr:peptidase U32 family protein [Aquibacillus kalidii]
MDTSYRPELITTARDMEELKQLANIGADALTVGHQHYGLRVAGDFSLFDIKEAVQFLHASNKKLYVLTNAIFHNERLETLPAYLQELDKLQVDGIICGDPSIFPILNEMDLNLSIHWNPETLSTNYETLNYWHSKGISRAVLSNELSIEAIKEIKNKLSIPVEIQVHGMTCIFQSKRKLVSNYYNYIGDSSGVDGKQLHLKQFKEADSHYPIFEDCNGTHIMSNEDLCMMEFLQDIFLAEIDCVRINGMYKSRDYQEKIVSLYRTAIDTWISDQDKFNQLTETWKHQIIQIQPDERKLDTGFYYKEQIY